MARNTRLRHSAVLVVLLVAPLAGCVGPGGSAPTAPATTATATPVPSNGTLEVHVINVGQAESTLVVGQRETLLVDTGSFTNDGAYVREYLAARGIDRIDHLVLSHADADHIGGTAALIDALETEGDGVGAVYDPGIAASTRTYERYLDAVERHNVTLYETRAGDRLDFADADVDVLAPPEPYIANRDRNDNSIVLKLTRGETSFLLTGDAGRRAERALVDADGDRLRSTVLKTGHHGSESGTSGPFLDAVSPVVATVSSAYDSQYGHPDEAVLDRLAARSIPTYWTATQGTIRFTTDGRNVTIATQRAASTDPERLREGTPVEPDATAPFEVRARIVDGNYAAVPAASTATATASVSEPPAALALVAVHADAEGGDPLADEYLVFANRGDAALDLSGWTVSDGAGASYTVPDGVTLAPGEEVRLVTGRGVDTGTTLYWNASRPVWNDDGDTVTVSNAGGVAVLAEAYG